MDVVGLAAAATDEGPKVLGAVRMLRVVNDLSWWKFEKKNEKGEPTSHGKRNQEKMRE